MATANIFTDGDYTSATPTGRARISRPFAGEGDNKSRVVEIDYVQQAVKFRPDNLNRVMNVRDLPEFSTAGYFPNAYLVDESAQEPLGSTLVKFTRTFAEIPARRVVGESYAWRRPGIAGGVASSSLFNISSVTTSFGQSVFVAVGNDFAVGDIVVVEYYFRDASGASIRRNVQREVLALSGSGNRNVTVALISEPSASIALLWALKYSQYRDEKTLEVGALVTLDYFLPGVSSGVATFLNIPIINAATIFDDDGRETNTLSGTTSPTQTEYLEDIKDKVMRVVTDSIVRRWRGNIFERSTRYVITQ